MNTTKSEYLPHMWNYRQHGPAPAAVTGKVLFSYIWKNCNTVCAVTVWPTEHDAVKLTDTMAVVVVLVRPVCVWTVNLSGASQGGAPGLALTPSPTRHFILSSSARRHLSLSLSRSLSLVQYNQYVAGSNCLQHSFKMPNETQSDPIKYRRLTFRQKAGCSFLLLRCLYSVRVPREFLGVGTYQQRRPWLFVLRFSGGY